ncbi:MAG: RHS repeat domain-containing protein [Planctomycetota bacterium]|jgi:RHS repeat-associated protein
MTYTWDSDNKLRSADIDANGTADVNFQYDALGRRVARTGTGGSVVFVQMDQQTIADYPVGGAATTPTFRYVYASYIDEPVVRKGPTSTSTAHFYHRNQQYSVTAMTTSTGAIAERYAYTAYGQPTILNASGTPLSPQTSTLNSRYSYTGREWDATLGLHHFRARWMSPSAGRFLRRDPIGYEDANTLYSSYFGFTFLDPTGMCCTFSNRYPIPDPSGPQPPPINRRIIVGQISTSVSACGCSDTPGDWEANIVIDAWGEEVTRGRVVSRCNRLTETFLAGEPGIPGLSVANVSVPSGSGCLVDLRVERGGTHNCVRAIIDIYCPLKCDDCTKKCPSAFGAGFQIMHPSERGVDRGISVGVSGTEVQGDNCSIGSCNGAINTLQLSN